MDAELKAISKDVVIDVMPNSAPVAVPVHCVHQGHLQQMADDPECDYEYQLNHQQELVLQDR